ncbi:FAD/NAD(P)-binding domain-containing protein [Exidia glandulosa HHB12029]|uniref:FAD/NAD(P)-binding domain-containing protein n=1 Tax=Exidia glandulosa HHB12029 TaxID=1314781 RepID=A0A165NVS3_EXIGL|nr:FAD/NAD(P)-binding domain-containing protein [Exidia glandulosa HHB12029]
MVNVKQLVLSLLPALQPPDSSPEASSHLPSKRIAIIGGGTAGIAVLKRLAELAPAERAGWDFVLYEQRRDVGGVWLPDLNDPHPPQLPETPLYPSLRTNTPVPSMTYPGVPYPPGTPLYPNHVHIASYLRNVTDRFGLQSYIKLNHEVVHAHWVGDSSSGYWNTTVRDKTRGVDEVRKFDHIVNSAGNYHYPRTPTWPGEETWLRTSRNKTRRVFHSIFYRDPRDFAGERVLIVGSGASGRDAAIQLSTTAEEVYLSIRGNATFIEGIPDSVKKVAGISHFTTEGVVFVDNTSAAIDTVFLGTGYHYLFPHLPIIVNASAAHKHGHALTTNLRYIFPLYEHILSLDARYPLGALTFVGLPQGIANAPSDYGLALFITALFQNASAVLPGGREELLRSTRERENEFRRGGWDPYVVGHRLVDGSQHDYQDRVVDLVKQAGAIPNDGKKYVEPWRREISTMQYLRRGWLHVEELGTQHEWLEGVETEEEWVELMRRLNEWQEAWEKAHNIPFMHDLDLY